MKFVTIVSLAAAALGSMLASSCCSSAPAPAPSKTTYIAPAK